MRYLIFIFLFISSFAYSDVVPIPQPSCQNLLNNKCSDYPGIVEWCNSVGGKYSSLAVPQEVCESKSEIRCFSTCSCPPSFQLVAGVCACPSGQSAYSTPSGSRCGPSSCPSGQTINVRGSGGNFIVECITPADGSGSSSPSNSCSESEKVYDPSTGQMVCPGSGDGSSSASSQMCVVPGDFDGDCVADNEQNSSAANSAPSGSGTSAATSTPASGGDGNDDGGGTGSGSGSGSGSGGGAPNSSSPSGSNSSWTPYAQYGNWIPVSENSNCPNKYKDASGQWWCSGSTGSNTSAKGECDPTSKDYLACITQSGVNNSSGSNSSECNPSMPNYVECSGKLSDSQGKISELADKFGESTDKEMEKFKKAVDDDLSNFQRDGLTFKDQPSILRSALVAFLPVSRSCNPPPLKIMGSTYELDCEYFELFKSAFGWFLAVLTVWNIWQLAIRPVDR